MSSFSEQIESLKNAAVQALSSAEELSALEQARVTYLGANSEFNGLLKQLGKLPKEITTSIQESRLFIAELFLI